MKMGKKLLLKTLLFVLPMLIGITALATHNRAGEIIYEHVSGFTYKITVITCTKTSAIADRPWLKIRFGDEPSGTTEAQLDSLARLEAEIIYYPEIDAQRNVYEGFHTYAGPGQFEISMEDPNRNSGILNLGGEGGSASVSSIFCIKSLLIISPLTGHNTSVILTNPPKEQACFMKRWEHNPAAFDEDGDQLVYSLIPCMGAGCEPLPLFQYPDVYTDFNDTFTIDPETGDVVWEVPSAIGEFNFAIKIEEYRNGNLVGYVVRDMQITVELCDNNPPVISSLIDTCIVAGSDLTFFVSATDPDNDPISLSANGGPLSQVAHPATFNPGTGEFHWQPECEEIRLQPYLVTFEAIDNDFAVDLVDVESVQITVVAPPIENPLAEPLGNSIELMWDAHPCYPIFSEDQEDDVIYKIYRRNGLYNFTPDHCELGVPEYTGYIYMGQSEGLFNTSYTDDQVFYGGNYCYMIVTCWPDGALSYASEEFCAEIVKEVPVMTKVSVGLTATAAGVDTIWWSPPTELDTEVFQAPYKYRLYHGVGNAYPQDLIYTSSESNTLYWADTTYVHENINTVSQANNYRVEFYFNSNELASSSSSAASPFLTLTPNDNQIELSISAAVPWFNSAYKIYRKGPGETEFTFLATSSQSTYIDDELTNNEEYCYYVEVIGTYNAQFVPDPLINFSQQVCAQPYDRTPPCPPTFSMVSDCSLETNVLTWTNPNNTCADDVTGYNIYYAPFLNEPLALYAHINLLEDTVFVFNENGNMNSIAGCFAVTALDTPNLWPDGLYYQNESAFGEIICVDNCPIYFLPNIFSPNGDDLNDYYQPFEYRFIKDIELNIFNRWGALVFDTTNPDILWNGIVKETGELATDGVYYYTITVNTIRLAGIVPESFSGTIQLMNGKIFNGQ
jgi:gliding motility-associated-like protein